MEPLFEILKLHNSIKLFRVVNNKTRYYNIYILKNLFDDYVVTREYGSIKNKKPTRVIENYFISNEQCLEFLERFLAMKIKKGYKLVALLV